MLLGAVGSFFSGSVATSNMTFGLLQQVGRVRSRCRSGGVTRELLHPGVAVFGLVLRH